MVDASDVYRLELERRIGFHLDMVSLDDLLIPSIRAGDQLFDVDTVHRILVNFLQQIEEEESEQVSQFGYESEGLGSPSHESVGHAYLAEIAPDSYLDLRKFSAIIEILPDYARVIDDGLYRAIDIYMKVRLKSLFSGSSGDGFLSQGICSGVPSIAMSPRDNYASLRRENRDQKLEISRMRVRLSELEKEQGFMKEGMREKLD